MHNLTYTQQLVSTSRHLSLQPNSGPRKSKQQISARRSILRQLSWAVVVAVCFALPSISAEPEKPTTLSSGQLQQVRSLLSNRCFACHGPDAAERKGGFRIDQGESVYQAADSGKTPVVPHKPDESEALKRMLSTDDDERMPPPSFGKALEPKEVDLIRDWIKTGAPALKHWSFVTPTRPALPATEQYPESIRQQFAAWLHDPIDRFVLKSQLNHQLSPSPPATRETLLRRLSLDLIGLPPSRELLDSFVQDERPDAIERVVDRLLASPKYGEHWARKWLDLARYADSAGYADDPPRTIWAYRDWVIRAINADMPLDQFTVSQLAGDLLPNPTEDDLIATAFHRNTLTNNEGGTNDEEFRNVAIVDRVNTTMAVWMGVTFNCAQCHTHKYDPFTQEEYFKIFDIFNQSQDADRRDESPTIDIFTADQLHDRKRMQTRISELEKEIRKITPQVEAEYAQWLDKMTIPQWSLLKPTGFRAKTNTEATWNEQGLVRVRPMQDKIVADTFTLELEPVASSSQKSTAQNGKLTAIRLRTVPLKELPGGGAGLGDGNFVLTDVKATLKRRGSEARSARYVRIELPGADRILSLAEVQAFSGINNVAAKGKATQSTTAFGGDASRAIDGKTNGNYEKNSVTHTAQSKDPWWEVDLGSVQALDRVVVWNRTDNSLQPRLAGAVVSLLDQDRKVVVTETLKEGPKDSATIDFSGASTIRFSGAYADFEQTGFPAAAVIDGDKASGWAVGGEINKEHTLTLIPDEPIEWTGDVQLRIELAHDSSNRNHLLASFDVSGSSDATASDWARMGRELHRTYALPTASRTPMRTLELKRFFATQIAPVYANARKELADLEKKIAGMKAETSVPVMREMADKQRRKTFVQLRGNYKSLGDEVRAGLPKVFEPKTADTKMDRLALAHWLTSQDNPLTARVMANRYWEALYGLGIVRTSEEFGSQGDLPSHPELIDYLATELLRMEWDSKRFLRSLVLTETYQQTSEVSQRNLDADSDNVWLARGPRVRLSAEMVRDQALAASGLLSHKMYGAPVRPPQPSLGLSAAFGSKTDWEASQGEDRYRRGLYTTWRRSNPYPSMATFDAPSREVCTLRRDSTNTPLQALVTLNDPGFVEAAQALARRVLYVDGQQLASDADRLRLAFFDCTSREPSPRELRALEKLLLDARTQLKQQPEDARKLATNPLGDLPKDADPVECAAWTAVGNVLLNLDEVLMKR